jgi:hypothetical protein
MSTHHRAPRRAFHRRLISLGVVALVAVGCQGKGDVAGKVTYHGKTVVFGSVLFEASDGSLRQGNIGRDGRYSVSGVTTGDAKVAVSSRNPNSADFVTLQRDGGKKPPPRPDIPDWFPIPDKYDAPYKSGLTYTINRGENKIDIALP